MWNFHLDLAQPEGRLTIVIYCNPRARKASVRQATLRRLIGNTPLPVAREVYGLAALHRQRRYAAHLIAIRDAAPAKPLTL
jgi:hypothetical protein